MIKLGDQHRDEMGAHGERDYPYECCGLLLGRFGADGAKIVVENYPISNAREEAAKRNRFLITPEELMRGERYAETKRLEVIGFYHSHPDHPAVPSQYDLDHAWPVYSYIVVSVNAGNASDLRSWEMEPDRSRFNEERILNDTTADETSMPAVDEEVDETEILKGS
ncbi:MAG: M67 family metallopeptidase [Acidobacteriota bacterium]|nr:M67 family metallopeptidase [Acidobacteriota bacterium]